MGERAIKMPDVGEGVAEAEIVEWCVKVGDLVREDQVVASVMTDKATVEIPTPVAGKVLWLGGAVGDVLAVGAPLIRIETADGAKPAPAARNETDAALESVARELAALNRRAQDAAKAAPAPEPSAPTFAVAAPAAPEVSSARSHRPWASPAVRRRALQAGVDLGEIAGGGPQGRIVHEDLDAYLARSRARARATQSETIKIVGLRKRIAENMAESSRRVAHFSYVEEIDVTALEELRAALNAEGIPERPKLTLLPFLVLALVKSVANFPQMNTHYDDEAQTLTRHGAVHLGIATQTATGLMVPVLRHAEARDIWDCAREIRRVSEAARQGAATREELSGSTLTLTSLGALGGVVSTPLVNRPEVAIVGVNKIVVRPVWRDGGFVPRKVMNLSSSFDHRVVDGHDAASFIQRVRVLLETPALLFVEG